MSNQSSNLPWGKQPVTCRDLVVFLSVGVFTSIAAAFLMYNFLQGQSGTTSVVPAASQPTSGSVADTQSSGGSGQALFEEKCIACHTIGGGPLVGPDLDGVTARRDRDWLLEWIQRPDEVLAREDPIAKQLLEEFNNVAMPNQALTEEDAASILAFLENPSGEISTVIVVPEGGNPNDGKAIFSGSTSLNNGGPACMSCHSMTGIGAMGGGTLGPDLTNVYSRYGEGLSTTLESLPFPTMEGVFAEKPLTDAEVADLYAYFEQMDQKETGPISYNIVWIGLGGFLVFSAIGQFTWRKRFSGVRKPLLGGRK